MTKYELGFEFGGDVSREEAEAWLAEVRSNLPEGTEGHIRTVPLVLDASEVTEEHAGNRITIRGYKPHTLDGILDHVFPTGNAPMRSTYVVDGKAYDIPAYSLVELGEW